MTTDHGATRQPPRAALCPSSGTRRLEWGDHVRPAEDRPEAASRRPPGDLPDAARLVNADHDADGTNAIDESQATAWSR